MSKILTDDIIPGLKAKTAIEDSGWLDLEFDTSNFEVGLGFHPQYRKLILPNGGGGIIRSGGCCCHKATRQQYAYHSSTTHKSRTEFHSNRSDVLFCWLPVLCASRSMARRTTSACTIRNSNSCRCLVCFDGVHPTRLDYQGGYIYG